jgi:hypothetical protein
MNVIYQQINQQKYIVRTNNGKFIGEFIMDVDGYFYFWSENNLGAWPSYLLRDIADKMDELNKSWNEQLEKELNK